ncbi:MAG TPA: hypothetical protein VNB06_12320 [Thermoanaerobaculia bacterium]|nr:hypothetical protein [Thermoanaerobaculia bacterium]
MYGVAAYGWPWARERMGGSDGRPTATDYETGNPAALACVAQAQRAVDDFRDKAKSLDRAHAQLNWREAMRLTRLKVERAMRECRCDAEACVIAADAMSLLQDATQTFESTVLGGGIPHDVPSRLARIDGLLARARATLARNS